MDGNDLISYFQNGLKAISPVGPIVGAIFTAIFYRKKVRDAEFEKLKAKKFQEVADQLPISIDKYREIERGRNIIYLKDAKEISKVLGFTLDELCDYADKKALKN